MDSTRNDRESQSLSANEAPPLFLRRSRRLNRTGAASDDVPYSSGSSQPRAAAAAAATATMAATTTSATSTTRPVPRHHSTWISQNRQIERQRSFYHNYYSNSRNRSATQTNGDSQSVSPPSIPTIPQQRQRSGSLGAAESRPPAGESFSARISQLAGTVSEESIRSTSPLSSMLDLTELGEAEPVFNSASTQTSTFPRPTNRRPPSPDEFLSRPYEFVSPTPTPISNPTRHVRALPLVARVPNTNFYEYLQHFGALLTRSNTPAIYVSDLSGRGNADRDDNEPIDVVDHLNFEAIFGLDGNFFSNGLSKQDINRHTISYEYKASAPLKRKRMKTEDGEAAAPSAQTSTATANDGCSICLDKLNPNVTVRRLPCLHIFHIKCIDKWLKQNKKCPICRIAITINYDTLISSLESGSSIDQCLSQQESSSRPLFRPTITLQVASNGGLAALSSYFASPSAAASSSRSGASGSSSNNNNNNNN